MIYEKKDFTDQYNQLLKLLLILIAPWTDIIFDFVIRFQFSNSYNTVLIGINWLTKERHYILYI